MSGQDPQRRVLVVDDEEAMCRLLGRILAGADYECFFASDAAEARLELQQLDFALMLCDVQMPGESGLDLVRYVVKEHPSTATLMVSGLDDPEVARVAVEIGAYGYLIKPFGANEVIIAALNASRRRDLEIAHRSDQTNLEHRVRQRTDELQQALRRLEESATEVRRSRAETIERLARAVECRDPETGGHIERMSRYCAVLATKLELHPESIRIASPMHDVGKIGVADQVLLKPGRLTPDERAHMQTHAEIGHRILAGSGSSLLDLAASIALTHHERYDGAGYPQGLAGAEIPIEGRIAAVSDVFDALTSDRVYRPAFPFEEAVEMVRTERAKHFDPDVHDAFIDALPEIASIRASVSEASPAVDLAVQSIRVAP